MIMSAALNLLRKSEGRLRSRAGQLRAGLGVVVASTCISLSVFILGAASSDPPPRFESDHPVIGYRDRPVEGGVDWLIGMWDGSTVLAVATDPFLSRPDDLMESRSHYAYRAQRIGLPWMLWAVSFNGRVDPLSCLVGMVALSVGLVSLAVWQMAGRRRVALIVCVVNAVPGVFVAMRWASPDLPAAAALLLGLVAWNSGQRRRAGALWIVAVLIRETSIIGPLAVIARSLLVRRDRLGSLLTGVPALAAGAGWQLVVRWRVGPASGADGNLGLPSVDSWQHLGRADGLVLLAVSLYLSLLASSIFAAVRSNGVTRWIAAGHLVLALALGPVVLGSWQFFSRVLILPTVLCLALAIQLSGQPRRPRTEGRALVLVSAAGSSASRSHE
jgi:hypothetical protein